MTLSRREAEMGFGDEIPKRGMGWQPHSNPSFPESQSDSKKQESGSEAKPDSANPLKTAA